MICPHELFTNLSKLKPHINLTEINELDIACKSVIQKCLQDKLSVSAIKIQAILDYTYERINIGNWKDVMPYLRKTMTIASYIKLLVHLQTTDTTVTDMIKEMYQIIDYGLLFGCPLESEPKLLQKCASILNNCNKSEIAEVTSLNTVPTDNSISEILNNGNIHYNGTKIEIIDCPSMESFYKDYIKKEKPVVLQNCINHWPALLKWKDQNYLLKLAGLRTVPVELGSKYTDLEWTQKLMTLEDFIKDHIFSTKETTGYLAQYQLFDQIPELKTDISEPEYCCFSDKDEPVDINAWYGPKGTISPLHHDPKKNLLAQIVGEKRIFVFSPGDSDFLYPHDHELLNNTARVDPRNPDYDLYPKYKEAKVQFCVLHPGQMLYIPPKWWHYVESLSISFSVSFWWE